ncbi:hypothetical protein GCM10025868_11990 [Angustibacter aerolatus]|uniref:Peptidase M12B domain-containing protein n=1 Tax=Angustibacter aerolatus TaxID=1162965 RepID=A0ABQ6JDR8_9ACTN|nr:hypothetical protein GCM10025868_11990 [Angustibacter aerolatus]
MWTDANRLCGIGLVYLSDTKAQSNSNNGAAPQWARIDNGCWGYGNGGTQHSVEAHELAHTLGSVMGGAPHATSAGHCYDESDTMCYADGGGKAMQQVCAPNLEYLLDCDNDDYYSTYPDPGSWLDTHWNVARLAVPARRRRRRRRRHGRHPDEGSGRSCRSTTRRCRVWRPRRR